MRHKAFIIALGLLVVWLWAPADAIHTCIGVGPAVEIHPGVWTLPCQDDEQAGIVYMDGGSVPSSDGLCTAKYVKEQLVITCDRNLGEIVLNGCNLSELARLTRWYVEHVQLEPLVSRGDILTIYQGGCEAFPLLSERYACMATAAREKEEVLKEYATKREELLRVLAACEG